MLDIWSSDLSLLLLQLFGLITGLRGFENSMLMLLRYKVALGIFKLICAAVLLLLLSLLFFPDSGCGS